MVRRFGLVLILLPLLSWAILIHGLRGEFTWLLPLLFMLLPLTGYLQHWDWAPKKSFKILSLILLGIFSVLLLLEILMMPYQAYTLWFDLLERGMPRGRVSQLFAKLGSLLTALLCWRFLVRPKSWLELLYLPVFFFFLLAPSLVLAVICLALLLLPLLLKENGAAQLILICLGIIFGITGFKAEPRGIGFIDRYTNSMGKWVEDSFPNLPLAYRIPLYGQSLSTRVEDGAPPVMTSQLLLKVTGTPGQRVYLRTKLYRDFSHRGNLMELRNYLDRNDLTERDQDSVFGEMLEITLQTDYMNMLPLSLQTSFLETSQGYFLWDSPSYGLVWSEPPLVYEEVFRLYLSDQPVYETPQEIEYYDVPPPRNNEAMVELAMSLRRDSDEETVKAISEFLDDGFFYNIETEGREDYVEHFLFESKEGYCLHFATAFVKLARLNGVTCRLAEGYAAYLPGAEALRDGANPGECWITGYSAHSWPEVYYPERGWQIVEVTPPFLEWEEVDTLLGLDEDSLYSEDLEQQNGGTSKGISPWVLVVLGAPLIFLFLYMFILRGRKKSPFPYLQHIRKLGLKRGFPDPEKDGWKAWFAHWHNHYSMDDESLEKILFYRYSSHKRDERTTKMLKSMVRDLKRIKQLN